MFRNLWRIHKIDVILYNCRLLKHDLIAWETHLIVFKSLFNLLYHDRAAIYVFKHRNLCTYCFDVLFIFKNFNLSFKELLHESILSFHRQNIIVIRKSSYSHISAFALTSHINTIQSIWVRVILIAKEPVWIP